MTSYPETDQIKRVVSEAQHIVIIQADNPDGDSLGSALALEALLANMNKETTMYCSVDMPTYLRYMQGWDRVVKELPRSFDASIIVDASTTTLFDAFSNPEVKTRLASKPTIVLDHHAVTDNPIPFQDILLNDSSRSSTGELLYMLAKDLGWKVDNVAGTYIMASILGDTQGLTNELATSDTYKVMAELVAAGVSRTALEEQRREYGKMPETIFRYKAALIERTKIDSTGRIALAVVPQQEINTYSPLYNPAPLVQADMLQVKGIQLAIVLKTYDSGRITAAIRANYGYAIAGQLAEHFGGGGHAYASGFKLEGGKPVTGVIAECMQAATDLLDKLKQETQDENPEYTYTTN